MKNGKNTFEIQENQWCKIDQRTCAMEELPLMMMMDHRPERRSSSSPSHSCIHISSSSPLLVVLFIIAHSSCRAWSAAPTSSNWAHVPAGPPDPILGIAAQYRACPDPDKINVSVGAYRTADGQPWVLPTVLAAEERLLQQPTNTKEYLPIEGDVEFLRYAMEFAYGTQIVQERSIAAVQTLSGTGACRVAGAFLAAHHPGNNPIYIPTPTWGNHWKIFAAAGLDTQPYRYFDRTTRSLDIEGLLEDLRAAPDQSIVLLHACAHNPTGCDPTQDEWKAIANLCSEKKHVVLFDSAYQGFASGDPEADAWALRYFVEETSIPILLAQSFAKNFGLYGERCGTLSVICGSDEERERVVSQLRTVIRPMYSSPPRHGSSIVKTILGDEELRKQYRIECASMADRMLAVRTQLAERLGKLSTLDWSHLTRQIGMFAFTGHLQPEMCDTLTSKHSIFLTRDGRISLAGLNEDNLERVAQAIHQVTSDVAVEAPAQ